jgi:hypothetical protein
MFDLTQTNLVRRFTKRPDHWSRSKMKWGTYKENAISWPRRSGNWDKQEDDDKDYEKSRSVSGFNLYYIYLFLSFMFYKFSRLWYLWSSLSYKYQYFCL